MHWPPFPEHVERSQGDRLNTHLQSASIGGSNRFYLYDRLGSTRQLLNDAQTTTDTYSYEAFGNLMASTGSTANPYRYVGSLGYYQTGTSLTHLGARYYMPEIGRFVQRDPVRGASMSALYVYAEQNSSSLVDPAGRAVGGGFVTPGGLWRKDPRDSIWVHPDQPITTTGSFRFQHCYTSCRLAQEAGPTVAAALGYGKEIWDYLRGFAVDEGHAYSAFQPSDFEDNAVGRAGANCADCRGWCISHGLGPNTPEGPPGPFYPYFRFPRRWVLY